MKPQTPKASPHEINVNPYRKSHWKWWVIALAILLLIAASRSLSIFLSATWFSSLGFRSVYWYILEMKSGLFSAFVGATFLVLGGALWLLQRHAAEALLHPRSIIINNQAVSFTPARTVRIVSWLVAGLLALIYGLGARDNWSTVALFLNQAKSTAIDPVLGKPASFYLFSYPFYDILSDWLFFLAVVILIASVVFAILSVSGDHFSESPVTSIISKNPSLSVSLGLLLVAISAKVWLSRYPLLWQDHQAFSGVNYVEAHHLIPGLSLVAATLILGAVFCLVNVVRPGRLSLIVAAILLPAVVYGVACIAIPSYVTSFVVRPNELGRETPFIDANISATRNAFGLDRLELRDFDPSGSIDSSQPKGYRPTLDNVRLWDWRALQDTLRQTQEIRTYYDFNDVDVDRYVLDGKLQQMMLAARELDVNKLPEQSRNWVNEKLIYTHGYGVTMNSSNGFTAEGLPQFILSNMPVDSSAPEIKVTRPQIYYGQKTDTDVYVDTRQKEFDFPQGESNNYSTYEGDGGIVLGSGFRKILLAAALGDLAKIPFSDAITPDTRALINRNIVKRVNSVAPFLIYDKDPYIVVTSDGRLVWIMDAYTEASTFPYSRHYDVADRDINYIRNSVKVTIDAYTGDVSFYIFDKDDPIIQTYRNVFPALFKDQSAMPADIRAHIRYPETLFRAQGEAFSLYHTQNAKSFFQREDVWSVANQVSSGPNQKQVSEPLDPYFVLMHLPGENSAEEFAEILPFTPANRNNMIGWMAGRSDGEAYGSLFVFNFPKSRLIDGPLQIEARIDQNAQLSAQFTLWNQQGSHVQRGNLLVVPIGNSLLYVESIYLKAERSPMPELRLVVLATQDKLVYGLTYDEALANLFGAQARATATPTPESGNNGTPQPQSGAQPAARSQQDLIKQAASDLSDYKKLTSEGKFGEAGQKLESATKALEELNKNSGGH